MQLMNINNTDINVTISYDNIGRTQISAYWTGTPGNCGSLPLIVRVGREYVVDAIKREITRLEAIDWCRPDQFIGKLKELLDWTDSYEFRSIK